MYQASQYYLNKTTDILELDCIVRNILITPHRAIKNEIVTPTIW